jgi:hypothetical protein
MVNMLLLFMGIGCLAGALGLTLVEITDLVLEYIETGKISGSLGQIVLRVGCAAFLGCAVGAVAGAGISAAIYAFAYVPDKMFVFGVIVGTLIFMGILARAICWYCSVWKCAPLVCPIANALTTILAMKFGVKLPALPPVPNQVPGFPFGPIPIVVSF